MLAFSWVMLSAAARMVHRPGDLAARARWLQGTSQRLLRVLGVRLLAIGEPSVGPVIVSNHVSYIDILVLAASRPVVFVAKREVKDWPIFGWFARQAGTCFVDRERRGDVARVAAAFAPAVASGVGVVIFLEGTSTNGQTVRPFKSSLLAPVVTQLWPVVPTAISYSLPSGHDVASEVCWWGDMTLTRHLLHLFTLGRIDAFVASGVAERAAVDRKELALRLHQSVTRLHRGLTDSAAKV